MPKPNQNQNQNQNPNPNSNPNNGDFNFNLTETSPSLGNDRVGTAFDLVEQMHYLYVRVVKVKELKPKEGDDSSDSSPLNPDPYVEVKIGNFIGLTKHFANKSNAEWNQVFALLKDQIQSPCIEITVKDKDKNQKDGFIGRVSFDLTEVPKRVPPDSPLAPQWYRLEDKNGNRILKGELMLAVWIGTQADEAFSDSYHLDVTSITGDGVACTRSKVYLSPRLWYVRVNVIEAQDLQISDKSCQPEFFVKVGLGNLVLRTKTKNSFNLSPFWNEDLMFVVAEPFEEMLVLSVEDKVGPNKDEVLGKCLINLQKIEKRVDHKPPSSKWYNLEKTEGGNGKKNVAKLSSKIHLRVCLDGGYHVLDELTHYSSDLRATARQLWAPSIGVLELGILNAQGLSAMKLKNNRGTTDAYCVAKYGQKWIRTRTIVDSFNPKWNEQYTWEVFDPCTVITIGVFDNSHLQGGGAKDLKIGKVRIRLSTLESNRVYTHFYPLIVLSPDGVKKMGEIQLAVRFTCSSLLNMLQMYSKPLLPKMHYLHPLSVVQIDSLRHQATQIVSARLNRAEPPLRKEVVEYMLDVGSQMWSIRKSKANYCRILDILLSFGPIFKWFDRISNWKNPLLTLLVHLIIMVVTVYPQMILSMIFFYIFLMGIWKYRVRPRNPPHMDIKLSHADRTNIDELDEEFDSFPSSKPSDVARLRYDRLRSIGSRMQTVVGDLANQGERLQNLLSWRDPRATALFLFFCFILAIVVLVIPFRAITLTLGFYLLRHPSFRYKVPSVPMNFFRRLPAKSDSLL